MTSRRLSHLKWGGIFLLVMTISACSTGYRIHKANGVETLYHIDGSGTKRIVYVLNDQGILKVHDNQDPFIRQYYRSEDKHTQPSRFIENAPPPPEEPDQWVTTRNLVRIGRILAAKKRRSSDPIFVNVHTTELGPAISELMRGVERSQRQIGQYVHDQIKADDIIRFATHWADVELYCKGYFKEAPALNVKTHKVVPVNAFHFEVYVKSNYLPGDRQIIKGSGHWIDHRQIIKWTMKRVNTYITKQIGSSIPRDREPFAPQHFSNLQAAGAILSVAGNKPIVLLENIK